MAARSLTATPDGIDQIRRALTDKKWVQDDLWKQSDCSRQPAVKFCSGKPISKKLFVGFCELLALDWEAIAGLKTSAPVAASAEPITDINDLVQTIRQQVYADIHHRCGTMRVLDMEQPIGIGDIYTSVNIFEKLSKNQRFSREKTEELSQNVDSENFDRFRLGRIKHERTPGIEAVERHRQLMVLGKPGAGKTTFMKRLATLCNQGTFQAQRVPVFVTLKEFAEAKGQPGLLTFIARQWAACKVVTAEALAEVLERGQALILLDGLDEVQETDHDRILQEIKDFTRQYRDCQFVMTCRIAAREYTFQHFTEVEVADFDDEQIAEFAAKWFKTKGFPEKAQTFTQQLNENKQIRELTNSPLLLTLLCLIFEEREDLPPNRAELYEEGIRLLLKKWDTDRAVKRDQIYKKLSLQRKEELFGQLAFKTFERGDYFFKQSVVERHITDYIRNLPGAQEDEDAVQLDSEAVLKSIEAQHGLLVERARGIYSFSHLTFQEYFTAKQITRPTAQLPEALVNLAQHVTKKRYREIFLLTVSMLPEADELLISIKQQVDLLLADHDDLQALIGWAAQKAESVDVAYKPAAVRAHYLSRVLDFSRVFALSHVLSLDGAPSLSLSLDGAFSRALSRANTHAFSLSLVRDFNLDHARALARDFNLDLNSTAKIAAESNPTLKHQIDKLRAQLPSFRDLDIYWQWWTEQGADWIAQLRQVMIEHRNIGHNRQFTQEQKGQLQQYYDANKLLIDCLNSDCYVTKATQHYIEDTLLLPMSEIEKKNAEYEI